MPPRPLKYAAASVQPPRLARVGPGAEMEVERPREEQHRPDGVAGVGDRVRQLADR